MLHMIICHLHVYRNRLNQQKPVGNTAQIIGTISTLQNVPQKNTTSQSSGIYFKLIFLS